MGHAVTRLKHCATSLKVAGPIPDGVIGIFHLRNNWRYIKPSVLHYNNNHKNFHALFS
jgi:hypothetical protein